MKLYKPSDQLLPSVKANLEKKDNQDPVFILTYMLSNQPDADHFAEIYFAIRNGSCA